MVLSFEFRFDWGDLCLHIDCVNLKRKLSVRLLPHLDIHLHIFFINSNFSLNIKYKSLKSIPDERKTRKLTHDGKNLVKKYLVS